MNFRTLREAYKNTEIERFNYNFIDGKEEEKDILFIYEKGETKFFLLD